MIPGMIFIDRKLPPRAISKIGRDNEDEIINCMPFSSGRYRNIIFEGRKIMFTNNPHYLMQQPKYGQIALDFPSLEVLWITRSIPDKLIKGIQLWLNSWKKHFEG